MARLDKQSFKSKFSAPNFISDSLRTYGENFLNIVAEDELQRNVERLIRSIVRGRVDLQEYGRFIIAERMINAIATFIQTKIRNTSMIVAWGNFYYSQNSQSAMYEAALLDEMHRTLAAYNLLLQKFAVAYNQKDPSILWTIRNELKVSNLDRYI